MTPFGRAVVVILGLGSVALIATQVPRWTEDAGTRLRRECSAIIREADPELVAEAKPNPFDQFDKKSDEERAQDAKRHSEVSQVLELWVRQCIKARGFGAR